MSHRRVPVPLILAAMLIAGSWVGRGANAPELRARAQTVGPEGLDLNNPAVLKQLRSELWEEWRVDEPSLQSLPSEDAMTLTPVTRPLYELRQGFWTGRPKLIPSTHDGSPRLAYAVLVSHHGQALATGEVDGYDGGFFVSSVWDATVAQNMLDMGSSEKLLSDWETGNRLRVKGDRAFSIYSGGKDREGTPLIALMNPEPRPLDQHGRVVLRIWIAVTLLAVALLFPWTSAPRHPVGHTEKSQDHG